MPRKNKPKLNFDNGLSIHRPPGGPPFSAPRPKPGERVTYLTKLLRQINLGAR